MERDTIRRIREAVRSGALGQQFTPEDVNRTLKINWAGTFLPKHRKGNPGGYTVLFVRAERGVYRFVGKMERDTIRRIRQAVKMGRLRVQFTATEVNKVLKIDWAATFLPKHRKGNPGGYTVLFTRVERGVYRLA